MKALGLLDPGDVAGSYVVQDLLGQGGMAAVYRVRHEKLDSVHVLKVVTVPSRSVMTRLMAEGRVQARLSHPNIVSVTDVVEVAGCPGLVMEYVDGPSLHELAHGVRLPLPIVDVLARGLIRGVGAAHHDGVVHRDLKPANVLVQLQDELLVPKVADFGLVKERGTGSQTRTGAFMGTPHYMAPEQIRSSKDVDGRADLWAVGAILYELLTGHQAFPGDDVLEVFNRVATGTVSPLQDGLPERMVRAVELCLQPDPEARVPSAEELLAVWSGDVTGAEALSAGAASERVIERYEALRPLPVGQVAARRPPPTSPTLGGGRGAMLALLTGTGGLLLVGSSMGVALLVAGGLWWASADTVEGTTSPVVEPALQPVPVPPPEPAPVELEPAMPTPAKPAPAPDPAPPTPAPKEEPREEPPPAPTAPEPSPVPVPRPAVTSFASTGPQPVALRREGQAPLAPGEVEPGDYLVVPIDDPQTTLEHVTIEEGRTVTLKCANGRCKVRVD